MPPKQPPGQYDVGRMVDGLQIVASLAHEAQDPLVVTINDLINLGLLQAPTTFQDDGED